MNTNIGADAAKLAGLQIDTLSKYRAGQLTLGQWERFNNLSLEAREARFGDWKKPGPTATAEPTELPEKFALLVDLGIITVPADYDHRAELKTFAERNREKFYYYNDDISDQNFPNPTRILRPGERLRVRAFKQVVGGTTTSEERLAFFATQKAIHTGAQGLSLVFEERRDQLPKGKWYVSFDEEERLWVDAGGYHRAPRVGCYLDGDFEFYLGDFRDVWRDDFAFLCFTEVEADE
ncbi:MAG: hypothetical protein WDZ85_02720 [Candidatus Paceibacterota bacterium]